MGEGVDGVQVSKRLQRVYEGAPHLEVTSQSRLVLMSDCHRGVGTGADNFAKNQNLYYVAMQHYDREGFTYIELGDGDELWENKHFSDIAREYAHVFELLGSLYEQGRMHVLYGNHDMCKRNPKWVRQNLYARLDEQWDRLVPLFPGLQPQEGMILDLDRGEQAMLLHGHQADFLNCDLWRLSKFLVRYLWQPLELIGVRDPTSAHKNPSRRLSVEGKLSSWAQRNGKIVVAGHTHRQVFPKPGQGLYFNDGCAVHPRHITAIEIENGAISLIKWHITTKRSGVLFVSREVMEGPEPLNSYFQTQSTRKTSGYLSDKKEVTTK